MVMGVVYVSTIADTVISEILIYIIIYSENPSWRQQSWVDYNAAIKNTHIEEDDEVSQKSDEDLQKLSDSRKQAHIHTNM